MKRLQSRFAGVIWVLWALFSAFTAFAMLWVMSDRSSYSFLLPYVTVFWGIAAPVHLIYGINLLGKPIEGSLTDAALRKKSAVITLTTFSLQVITAPVIPWA
jgi:hypothetical protein